MDNEKIVCPKCGSTETKLITTYKTVGSVIGGGVGLSIALIGARQGAKIGARIGRFFSGPGIICGSILGGLGGTAIAYCCAGSAIGGAAGEGIDTFIIAEYECVCGAKFKHEQKQELEKI